MNIDPKTGFPGRRQTSARDAQDGQPRRGGPQNTVEWDIIKPDRQRRLAVLHRAETSPTNQYNFATKVSGPLFDCAGRSDQQLAEQHRPEPSSPPGDPGAGVLPLRGPTRRTSHCSNGGGPIAGPVYYRFDPNLVSSRKWPVDFDGRAIFGEWTSNKLFTLPARQHGTPRSRSIDPLLTSQTFLKPMDFKFGPDGRRFYMIEWGTGFRRQQTPTPGSSASTTSTAAPSRSPWRTPTAPTDPRRSR